MCITSVARSIHTFLDNLYEISGALDGSLACLWTRVRAVEMRLASALHMLENNVRARAFLDLTSQSQKQAFNFPPFECSGGGFFKNLISGLAMLRA